MSPTRSAAQNAFHERLTRYVNAAFARRGTLLLSMLAPGAAYRREAGELCRAFHADARRGRPDAPAQVLAVPPYAGDTPQVLRLMGGLEPLASQLAGACVHGSIATAEEIPYSDFDALVILRDSVFDSPATLAAVSRRLGALRGLMFDYDPLQHHGWFVLTESDLRDYCQAWFPAPLFPWCRALLPSSGMMVEVRPRDSTAEYQAAFTALAATTLRQIESGPPPVNAYRLKSLLSQFMLLPSLYLQARDGTAVFKKESFALASGDFPANLWAAMEQVSAVRISWQYRMTTTQRLLLSRCLWSRRLLTRRVNPQVAPEQLGALEPETWHAAARLIRAMQARIAAGTS